MTQQTEKFIQRFEALSRLVDSAEWPVFKQYWEEELDMMLSNVEEIYTDNDQWQMARGKIRTIRFLLNFENFAHMSLDEWERHKKYPPAEQQAELDLEW